jgi:hypothetical protein
LTCTTSRCGCFRLVAGVVLLEVLTLAKALSLAEVAEEVAEAVVCAKLLTCVLNTNANAIEAIPAKTANDLFMVFSRSVPAQA